MRKFSLICGTESDVPSARKTCEHMQMLMTQGAHVCREGVQTCYVRLPTEKIPSTRAVRRGWPQIQGLKWAQSSDAENP
jgi:hypothetical protein